LQRPLPPTAARILDCLSPSDGSGQKPAVIEEGLVPKAHEAKAFPGAGFSSFLARAGAPGGKTPPKIKFI